VDNRVVVLAMDPLGPVDLTGMTRIGVIGAVQRHSLVLNLSARRLMADLKLTPE
jgi:hypothetical protein